MNKKISIFGLGYVGTALSLLLGQNNKVTAIDIDKQKVALLGKKLLPIKDSYAQNFLEDNVLEIQTSSNIEDSLSSELVIIATPTNYDPEKNIFDTKSIYRIVKFIKKNNPKIPIFIKSTVPVGFTDRMNKEFNSDNIIFSPEFLREGKALKDNLYPDRIVIGSECSHALLLSELLLDAAAKDNVDVLFTSAQEAESIKLFSNAYLAMRVGFFNELDNFAICNDLDSSSIVKGVCLDQRIGNFYNNPSFGFGGYCLPKDVKQLREHFADIPQSLIQSIISSNQLRKNLIADEILKLKPKSIGVYRLSMKHNSDNHRSSAVLGVIEILNDQEIPIYIYEPSIDSINLLNTKICNDLSLFFKKSDLVIANRVDDNLHEIKHKVYSRDIFKEN